MQIQAKPRINAAPLLLSSRGLLLLAIFAGCAHAPQKIDTTSKTGQWTAKVLLEETKRHSSHTINLDLLAEDHASLRMEISAALGVYLGTLVLHDGEVVYLLARDRKYFQGPASPEAFQRFLHVPLEPQDFFDLLFDRDLSGVGWVCSRPGVVPRSCAFSSHQLQVDWLEHEGQGRLLKISSPEVVLQLSIKRVETKVEFSSRTFTLEVPSDYHRVN